MAVLAPEAPKAATLDGHDVVHAAIADIAKWEDGPDGSLYVYGRATTPEVDTDEQIVDAGWSGPALKQWLAEAPALRVQHNPQGMPAGSGIKVEVDRDGDGAHWVKGVVDEPVAQKMVRKGHLRAFSVGIARPVIERDMTGKARGGIIKGGRIVEVSLVDSPANRSCWLEMVKAGASGAAEFTGTLSAPDSMLADLGAPRKGVTVEFPKDVSVTMKPSDLAKLATFRQRLVTEKAAARPAVPAVVNKTAEPGAVKRDFDPDVGGGVDRDKIPAEDFAGEHRSFPIVSPGDVSDAAHSLGRARGQDRKKIKRRIISIARRKGDAFVAELPAAWRKGSKASKSAAPDVTKCMTCAGTGMHDGKPCPDCKDGKKAAKAVAALERAASAPVGELGKKHKVMCGHCGAKQNAKHAHCPECGNTLYPGAMPVAKNHDFSCLGCGTDLDKGEKFCPGCGRENPGYLEAADLKIPANQEKSAKERVAAKSRKKKEQRRKARRRKEERAFGGHAAPEFGSEPDKAEKRKGKGKGRRPGAGVKGRGDEMPLPPHREPDGPPVEMFEDDAHLQDGDEHAEMAAAMRHKSAVAAYGITSEEAVLHDLTCPAFSPAMCDKYLPGASLARIDTQAWQSKALAAAGGDDIQAAMVSYNKMQSLAMAAVMLKTADPQAMHRIAEASHSAFLAANSDVIKTFRDATPGPGSAPTPGHVQPGQFRRPYIHAGHAAGSPQATGARTFPVTEHHPEAEDFTRGYLHAGHAADAPGNHEPRSEPAPGGHAGVPESVARDAMGMQHRDYASAREAMHDHLSRIAPGMCPMSPPVGHTQGAGRPVPAGVGAPEPHAAKTARRSKADKAAAKAKRAAKAARIAKRKAAAQKRRLERKVIRGKMSVNSARTKLGLSPFESPEFDLTAAVPVAGELAVTQADPEATVKAAVAPLLKQLKAQDRTLRKQAKVLNAIAGQPDTTTAPYRGAGGTPTYKASAVPAGPQTAAEAAALAQSANLRLLAEKTDSWDPVEREAARRELTAQLGINPMTGRAENNSHPFRT